MGKKSGFTSAEIEEIKRLYLQEGRSILQIPKILGKAVKTLYATPCTRPGSSMRQRNAPSWSDSSPIKFLATSPC